MLVNKEKGCKALSCNIDHGRFMSKIGIFFGTDTGTTRLVAKKIYNLLGE